MRPPRLRLPQQQMRPPRLTDEPGLYLTRQWQKRPPLPEKEMEKNGRSLSRKGGIIK